MVSAAAGLVVGAAFMWGWSCDAGQQTLLVCPSRAGNPLTPELTHAAAASAVHCCCACCARCAPQIILVRLETSPEDVGGMHAAQGILTARGGMTSHAAVVARGWGRPCVCGVDKLQVGGFRK